MSHKLLLKLLEKNIQIFTTKEILDEFARILVRDFRYSHEEIGNITEKVLAFVTLVQITSRVDAVKDDPEDNKVLECALDSDSEYVISYDKHLLNLKEFRGIKIVRPEEFLKILD